ncbi:MAG: type VI secretion system tube protein Hcp [Acidobacteriota bacterium]|nr:type VI secretion system tube protein Hcp [Acidobacteriota bacterium]
MAVVDYFLKIDGIDGESMDDKHKNEIEVSAFNFGATQTGSYSTGAGAGTGKVSVHDFHFTTKVNKASPKLFLACASGQHIKKAVLTCRKAGKDQQEYLKWTMSDLLVSSYQTDGSGGADVVPNDNFSFNFAKVQVEYKAQKADGTLEGAVQAGWDLQANKAATA